MSKKTIIFISTNVQKDGAEKSLVSLQSYLNQIKNIKTITIIPKHGLIEELLTSYNIDYIIWPFQGNVNAGRGTKLLRGITKMFINIFQAFVLSKKLEKLDCDIVGVHSNTITSEFGFYLAKNLKVPHVWHIREFGKLDFNFDFELGMKYMQWCTSKSAKIICNSKAVMEYYSKYFNYELLTYVHNGVDLKPKGVSDWDNPTFKMVLVGRLSKEKGQLFAVDACKKLLENGYNDFILDFYGEGAEKDIIRNQITEYGLEKHIRLCGYSNDLMLSSYHVGLMCSHHEAFGRVTVEYMANKLPVIGVNSGGTPEIIKNEISGILFNANDIDSLYQALKRLYLDRSLCQSMGRAGYEIAKNNFSKERYFDSVYDIYKDLRIV